MMTTRDNDDERDIWWCKRTDGQIVEHRTTEFENHRGHVQCIPIDGNRQASEGS